MQRLTDKICVVTGAARGIGRAIAARFHKEGAIVIVTDRDDIAGAATAAAIGCRFETLDVGEEADWLRLADRVPIANVVVNNAGVTGFEQGAVPHDPEHASLADWRAVHRVNLDGTFLGCRYAIAAMKRRGTGSIINISSRSGLVGIPLAAAYASSKAAIRNHSKTVALYCAQQGWTIRCNSLHPAAILTPMWEPMLGDGPDREAKMRALVADTPLQRFGLPEEVAAIAVTLASDEATYVTGTEINIDGGLLAGSAAAPVERGLRTGRMRRRPDSSSVEFVEPGPLPGEGRGPGAEVGGGRTPGAFAIARHLAPAFAGEGLRRERYKPKRRNQSCPHIPVVTPRTRGSSGRKGYRRQNWAPAFAGEQQ